MQKDRHSEPLVGFESKDQRIACDNYLRTKGHDTAWINPPARAARIAAAEAHITTVRATGRPPPCRAPGHNGG
eukprot:9955126-Heterocapsa_arctica.AAC.1